MIGPLIHLHVGLGHPVSIIWLAALGLLVGIVAGMFGVGGGFVLTPALIYIFGIPPAFAVGSALSQKCGTSVSSIIKYRKLGTGEIRIDLVMLGGSLMGVVAGSRILRWLDSLGNVAGPGGTLFPVARFVLDLLFFCLLTYVAVHTGFEAARARKRTHRRGDRTIPGPLARGWRIPPYIDLPDAGLVQVSVPVLALIGLLLGLASGIMGIGGGVLLMPVLLYGYGMSVRTAAGTGLIVLFATVALGTFEQGLHGNVSLPLAMSILLGSSVGTQIGVVATHRLPNRTLRLIFGVLVGATACLVGLDALMLGGLGHGPR